MVQLVRIIMLLANLACVAWWYTHIIGQQVPDSFNLLGLIFNAFVLGLLTTTIIDDVYTWVINRKRKADKALEEMTS